MAPDNKTRAIYMFASIFHENKCGLYGTRESFFEWCRGMATPSSVYTNCSDIYSVPGESYVQATYSEILEKDDLSNVAINVSVFTDDQSELKFDAILSSAFHDSLSDYCEEQLPLSTSMIMLIVLLAIAGLIIIGLISLLTWKYAISPSSGTAGLRAASNPAFNGQIMVLMSQPNSIVTSQ